MIPLSDKDIELICEVIDAWSGKLTWEKLTATVEVRLGRRYTRQTLCSHKRISSAFKQRKGDAATTKPDQGETPMEIKVLLDKIERLTHENQRLSMENEQLLGQFARWLNNAANRGISPEQLNNPLPPIDRGRTRQ